MVRTRLEIQVLEQAIEIVDDPDVVAIGEYLRFAWCIRNPEAAIGTPGNRIVVAARRTGTRLIRSRRRFQSVAEQDSPKAFSSTGRSLPELRSTRTPNSRRSASSFMPFLVARIPIRIVFDRGQDPQRLLRLGLAVEPGVRVR